jgi:hypothetical protein
MPQQEIFFEQQIGNRKVEVLKSYDTVFAHEAFARMQSGAVDFLADSLKLAEKYEPADIPPADQEQYAEMLWEDLQDGARENWNTFSYFVVMETQTGGLPTPVFVSNDWPTAEAFVKQLGVVYG